MKNKNTQCHNYLGKADFLQVFSIIYVECCGYCKTPKSQPLPPLAFLPTPSQTLQVHVHCFKESATVHKDIEGNIFIFLLNNINFQYCSVYLFIATYLKFSAVYITFKMIVMAKK